MDDKKKDRNPLAVGAHHPETLLQQYFFKLGADLGARMVNVSPEEREARRGKPVPGPTGWRWCAHCGGHMVPPETPDARCKRCP